jgi:hypothetical protein
VPTVVVGTDEFQSLGTLECKARGMPELRFAITRHPIGGLRPPLVAEKARAMAEATASAVLAVEAAVSAGDGG